ncbi:uncharacterized protein [Saccopteryx leptura]|uniref:uncharacterized protein isoform X2 n=1 Tax=Saccopteryx leptura TaxID=249018 RepID=UPI00339D09D4
MAQLWGLAGLGEGAVSTLLQENRAQIPDAPQGPAETSARRTEMEAPVASPSPENPRALPPLTAPASPSQPATPRGQTWPAQGGDPGVTISSSSASPN